MKISLTVLEIVLSLARLNHNFVHRSKRYQYSLSKHVNVFPLLKTVCLPNTLFKATPQKQWKFVFFDKFRLTALLLLLRTAKCKNHNVEVQTIKWYKSFFALPSTHNSAQLREKSVKISFARDG